MSKELSAAAPKWKFRMGLIYLLDGDGFYVSFNENVRANMGGLSMLGGLMASDDDAPETALCRDGKFFILNGDFRKEYEALVTKGWDACIEFFNAQSAEHGSSWTQR